MKNSKTISAEEIIATLQEQLKDKIGISNFNLWFGKNSPSVWIVTNNIIYLDIWDKFALAHIKSNFLEEAQILLTMIDSSFKIVLRKVRKVPSVSSPQISPVAQKIAGKPVALPGMQSLKLVLPPDQTFEKFTIGGYNKLAFETCRELAETVTQKQSAPVFIHAPTGHGKSHLLYAIIHEVLKSSLPIRLYYSTANDFAENMVQSIKSKTMTQFKKEYSTYQLFLLDDIHMLEGKKKTQEELLNILKILTRLGVPIVTTATVIPLILEKTIREELLSLLTSGPLTEITTPQYTDNQDIIRDYLKDLNFHLDDDVINYISTKLRGDTRKITSILHTLHGRIRHLGEAITIKIATQVMEKIILPTANKLTSAIIMEMVAKEYGITPSELKSKSRKRTVTPARHIAMWLAREHTKESLEQIGRTFNKQHATVLHAMKVVNKKLTNDTFQEEIILLKSKLNL